ncbi:MAG: Histidine kinaselike ATPase domain, partial [Solirubrobacteraceae bacterium]|nr:Histidine kinaselike ATPase domain [Solirubrobacteraceae bacterium]
MSRRLTSAHPDREHDREIALDLTVPAGSARVAALREAARAFAEGHGAPRPHDVAGAVWEACADALAHVDRGGGPALLRLTGGTTGTGVRFSITETPCGPSPPPDRLRSPRGLPLMAALADEVKVTRCEGRMCVRLDFAVAPVPRDGPTVEEAERAEP